MIDPKELRIGNYIQWETNHGWIIQQVTSGIIHDLCQDDYAPGNYLPIPITEERLIKAGFAVFNDENNDRCAITRLGQYSFEYRFKDNCLFILDQNYEALETRCEYLHHLQNIIYDLSDKELKI